MENDQKARVERAENALTANPEYARRAPSCKEAVTEAVTDLLTLAATKGIHPGDLASMALRHVEAEAPEAAPEEAAHMSKSDGLGAEQHPGESLAKYDERRADENEDRIEQTEGALSQIQTIAYDGVLALEAQREARGGVSTSLTDDERAAKAKLERIANIAESGKPDEDFRQAVVERS